MFGRVRSLLVGLGFDWLVLVLDRMKARVSLDGWE